MKKQLIIIFTLLFSFSCKSQSWIYHTFPDSAASWNISIFAECGMFGTGYTTYSFQLTGDTNINGQTYHKLSIPFVYETHTGTCFISQTTGYQAALREDIADKKVYIVWPDSSEQLLFDFTMEVGDILTGYMATMSGSIEVVQSIDSVLVNGTYRKRWLINPYYNIYLIEGVGSTFGFLHPSPGSGTDYPGYTLNCFQQNNTKMYPSGSGTCELITSYDELSTKKGIEIAIFPNPSDDQFVLSLPEDNEFIKIEVHDILGRSVLKQKIEGLNTILFDLDFRGTYFLTLSNKYGENINRKLIRN
jgi:hypothetical protein